MFTPRSSLQKKLWRELWNMRGQALAIILVIVGGVGVCIMSLSTYDSLREMRDSYYRDHNFAHVFASVKRAPESLLKRLADIPGVISAESRVVAQVNIEVPGFGEPISGLVASIPDHKQAHINRLHLLSGRLPDSRRDNEILISDAFAEAQTLKPGDKITAIINGRRRQMSIVGIALSPEYIYQIAPGSVIPDYHRFGVLWMTRKPLATAYDMDAAFNNVALLLHNSASVNKVIDRVDDLLLRYGGLGAYGRDEQVSNLFLQEEFKQLQTMAYLFPVIFLGVAVFLLNVVVTRLVSTQREIIAILKAFGYSNGQILRHYTQLIFIITALGILGGYLLGIGLGQLMTETYTDYYRFPVLSYTLKPAALIGVALLTCGAALLGTLRAVRQAVSLPPAEAMRPEPPQHYRKTWLEQLGIQHWLSQPGRMILRHLQRKPLKTLLSILGLSMASAIMMVGNFQQDAVKLMMHVQFSLAQKEDIQVSFYEPIATKTLSSLRAIPGVFYVEGTRSVAVRLHKQHRSKQIIIQGIEDSAQLQQLLDTELKRITLPPNGIMLSEHLAQKLGVIVGDRIEVEVLEGHRQRLHIEVTKLSQQFIGLGAYMRLDNLNRLMREAPAINSALLAIDATEANHVYRRLRAIPAVAGITLRQAVIDSFQQTLQQILLVFTLINALLGAVIAFGVVYNTVRIALAERARELASLRVLGYTRAEVAYILLGELSLLTVISLPIGFAIGSALCQFIASNLESDIFRIPLVLSSYTYSFSALVVILSAMTSALLVWRRLQQLNLVEVLKSRE